MKNLHGDYDIVRLILTADYLIAAARYYVGIAHYHPPSKSE